MNNEIKYDTNIGRLTHLSLESAIMELIHNAWEEVQLGRSEKFELNTIDSTITIINYTECKENFLELSSFLFQSNHNKLSDKRVFGGNGFGLKSAISVLYFNYNVDVEIISGDKLYVVSKFIKLKDESIFIDPESETTDTFYGTKIKLCNLNEEIINTIKEKYFPNFYNDKTIRNKEFEIIKLENNKIALNNLVLDIEDSKLLFSYNFLNNSNIDIRKYSSKKKINEFKKIIKKTIQDLKFNELELLLQDVKSEDILKGNYFEIADKDNFYAILEALGRLNPNLVVTTENEINVIENVCTNNNIIIINKNYNKYYSNLKSSNFKKGTDLLINSKFDKETSNKIEKKETISLQSLLSTQEKEILKLSEIILKDLGINSLEYKIKVYELVSNNSSYCLTNINNELKEIQISRKLLSDEKLFCLEFTLICIETFNIPTNNTTKEYKKQLVNTIITNRLRIKNDEEN